MEILTGVDYYPEQWPSEMWQNDLADMVKAGVSIVRIGEFSWSLLEPHEGEFDFSEMDHIIDLLGKNGLKIILGIPTCCPPNWLFRKYPDARIVGRDGQPTAIGIRGHRCLNSTGFRVHAFRLAEKLLQRYGCVKNILGWQIDNELETNFCMCETCADLFRKSLKEKFGTLGKLNDVWGTAVWSGTYSSWDEINPPFGKDGSIGWLNPAYVLDFERFANESTLRFVNDMCRLIRKYTPDAVITSNACFSAHTPDYSRFFEHMDIASYDNYPPVRIAKEKSCVYSHAFDLARIRGFKNKNFWIMEQLSGPEGCWCPISPTPLPGMIKGYAMQAVAHGANAVLFFRWRTASKGAEMFWHGLFEGEKPAGRRYSEFVEFNHDIRQLGNISETAYISQIAVIFDREQAVALNLQQQSEGFDYAEQCKQFYDAFFSLGMNVDVIPPSQDPTPYKVILVPAFFIGNQDFSKKLETFVQNGGTVLIGCRSGVKDETNTRLLSPLPGVFSELCGCTVSEYDPIGSACAELIVNGNESYKSTGWCDLISCHTAKVYARYGKGVFYENIPAITVNTFGNGKAWYIGTCAEKNLLTKLAETVLNENKLPFIKNLPEGIEICRREANGLAYIFIFNNTDTQNEFVYQSRKLSLAPFETRILKKTRRKSSTNLEVFP